MALEELWKTIDKRRSMNPAKTGKADEEGRFPEARYAYYRRCQRFRRNGEQCKAPALKGQDLCYKHAEQQAAARRYEELRRSLGLGAVVKGRRQLRQSLNELAQALMDGRLDYRTAAKLMAELKNRMVEG